MIYLAKISKTGIVQNTDKKRLNLKEINSSEVDKDSVSICIPQKKGRSDEIKTKIPEKII